MSGIAQVIEPARSLVRSWFLLTREEQQTLGAVLLLFILGVGVRAWRSGNTDMSTPAPVVVSSERSAR
jgi:hypothetical protein